MIQFQFKVYFNDSYEKEQAILKILWQKKWEMKYGQTYFICRFNDHYHVLGELATIDLARQLEKDGYYTRYMVENWTGWN